LGLWAPALAEGGGVSNNGYVVSPIFQNVSLGENEPQVHCTVELSNTTGTDQAFKLSTLDFGSLNESGGVAFLGSSTNDFAKRYGLSKWMRLDADTVTVPAGGSKQIGVTIQNADDLAGGGHYGAVLAAAQTAPDGPATTPRVGVNAVLSSLVLLIKQGGVVAGMGDVSHTSDGGWLSMPAHVTDRFKNNGNVHVVPRGLAIVKDSFGHEVERAAINEDSGNILPGDYRSYATTLMRLASVSWPGQYTVTTTYRIGGVDQVSTISSTFWYLGKAGLTVVILLVLTALAILFDLRFGMVRRYLPMPRLPKLRRRRA
jgi:hypothetical protein